MSIPSDRTPLEAWHRITERERDALELTFAGGWREVEPSWLLSGLALEGLAASAYVEGEYHYDCTCWGREVWEAHALREAAKVLEASR